MTTKSKTHSLIWQLVTYKPWLSAAYTGIFVLIYIMELAPRLLTKLFFDTLTGRQPAGFNLTSVIVLVLATRGFHILTIGAGAVIGARQRFAVGGLLRRNLLAHILNRPGAQAVPGSPGEALNTIRDDVNEVVGVMAWLADQIAIFTYTAIAMAIMLRIDVRITLLALLPLVVVIFVSRATSARAERYRKATREATARVNGALTEILGAVQAIKVAGAEPHATAHLDNLGQRRQHAIVRDRALNQLIISLCEEAGTLTAGMVLMLGASRIRNQTLTVGDFALLITSLDSITMFIVESGGFTAYFKQVGVAFERILALVRSGPTALSEAEAVDLLVAHHPLYLRESPPAVPFPAREPDDRLAQLTVSGLTYHYPSADGSDANGIEDITFSLHRGDFIVITGRIGAGKTTLLRALLGLLPAERGEIAWNGAPVDAPADFFVPPRSAYTAQIPHLFSETLRDNILMGLPEDRVDLLGAIQRAALVREGAAFFAIAVLTQGLTVANLYTSELVAWSATNALRLDLLRHCLHLDLSFHKAHKPGELTERIDSDVDALSNFFSGFALNVIGNGVLAIGVLALLSRESWLLGVSFTLYTIVGLLVLVRLREITIPFWDRLHDIRARFYGFLGEQFSGTEDIRANGAQAYVMRRFYQMLRRWLPIDRNASLAAYSGWMTNAALIAVGEALAYGLAGYLWFRGSITIGVAYLIGDYMGLLFGQIAELRWQLSDLQHAEAGIGRIEALFARQSRLEDGANGPLPAGALDVAVEKVSFVYEDDESADESDETNGGEPALADDERVLHDIEFRLAPGRVLGLLGRTGSGKTTLARLLMRLYDPTEGRVCLGGLPLTATTRHDVRQRVALVTQEVQLFRASVRDNLTFFNPQIADVEIIAVLRQLGLDAWLASLPEGLDTELSADGGGLSAGQAQLLAFARVFLFDPSLVILDEASSRLDPATERQIERAIDMLLTGRTGVIIAHRLNTVQRADEVLILEEGRIREHGPRAALAADPTSYFHHLLQTGMEEVLRNDELRI